MDSDGTCTLTMEGQTNQQKYGLVGWIRFSIPPNPLQVISAMGFYRSNDPTNNVKALKEDRVLRSKLQSHQVHPIVLQWYSVNKKYKIHIYKHKWIYAQWNGPSVTKPNPENCKNCSSKWLCTASVYNTTQNSSDSLPSYLQPTIIAQMLSIGGEGRIKVRNWPHYNCHVRWWQVVGLHSWSRKQQTEWYE